MGVEVDRESMKMEGKVLKGELESREEAPRIAAATSECAFCGECLWMLGGSRGPRPTEENSEETVPLGVKVCSRVCVWVCVWERERGQCYFNPELTSGCHTAPALLLQSADSSVTLPEDQLSHASLWVSLLPFSCFFFLCYSSPRCTGISIPAPLRTIMLCVTLLCVLYVRRVVNASGFLMKCPCNRSPCDTGNSQLQAGRLEPLYL